MLPIGGRPIISYAIQEAVHSGLEELYIIINSRKNALRGYLESENLQRNIRSEKQGRDFFWPQLMFIEQPFSVGSGDAIYRVRELIGNDPFALVMPDFIFFGDTPALGQLIPLYERFGCDIGGLLLLQGKEVEGFSNVGIVQEEKKDRDVVTILSLSNKIEDPFMLREDEQILKAAPRWILGPHFFSYLEKTKGEGEWDDTPALQMLCEERDVLGKIFKGRGFDVGNPMGYKAAEVFAANLDAGGKR